MPLTMPATLRTMDMRLVYDEGRKRATMRLRTWAVLSMGLGLGMAGALAQQQPAPQGQMAGMDMRADHTGSELGPLRIALGDETAEWTPEMLAALPH